MHGISLSLSLSLSLTLSLSFDEMRYLYRLKYFFMFLFLDYLANPLEFIRVCVSAVRDLANLLSTRAFRESESHALHSLRLSVGERDR